MELFKFFYSYFPQTVLDKGRGKTGIYVGVATLKEL